MVASATGWWFDGHDVLLSISCIFNKCCTSVLGEISSNIPFCIVFLFSLKNTIRWRDVKVCAFDNAKHRTYVDLKVKTFMTLVQGNCIMFYFICHA